MKEGIKRMEEREKKGRKERMKEEEKNYNEIGRN